MEKYLVMLVGCGFSYQAEIEAGSPFMALARACEDALLMDGETMATDLGYLMVHPSTDDVQAYVNDHPYEVKVSDEHRKLILRPAT